MQIYYGWYFFIHIGSLTSSDSNFLKKVTKTFSLIKSSHILTGLHVNLSIFPLLFACAQTYTRVYFGYNFKYTAYGRHLRANVGQCRNGDDEPQRISFVAIITIAQGLK